MITCQSCDCNTHEVPYECRECHREVCGDCVGVWPTPDDPLLCTCVDCDWSKVEVFLDEPMEEELEKIRLAEAKSEEAAV